MGNIETIINSSKGFMGHENFGKVTLMVGVLGIEFDDWDELALVCENIVIDWQYFRGILNEEEEGYIMKYAERILREKYLIAG